MVREDVAVRVGTTREDGAVGNKIDMIRIPLPSASYITACVRSVRGLFRARLPSNITHGAMPFDSELDGSPEDATSWTSATDERDRRILMRVFGRTAGAQTTTPDNLYFGPILRTLSAYVGSGVSRNSGVDESGTSARPRGHQDLFSSSGQTLFCLGLHPAIRRVALYFLGYSGYGPALSVLAGAAVRRMVEAADENKRSDEDGARGPTSFFELVAPDVDAMAVASANRVVGRFIKQVEGQLQPADVTTAGGMKISWRFPLGLLPPEPEKLKEVICPPRKGKNGIDDPDFHHESHDDDGAAGDSLDVLVFDPPPGVAMTVYRNVFAECTPRLVFFENFGWQYQPYSGIVLRGVEEDKQKDQQTKKSWHSFISASDPYFGFQSHLYNQKTKDDYHAHGLENFNLLAVAGRTGAKQRVEAAVTVAATVFEKETGVDGSRWELVFGPAASQLPHLDFERRIHAIFHTNPARSDSKEAKGGESEKPQSSLNREDEKAVSTEENVAQERGWTTGLESVRVRAGVDEDSKRPIHKEK